ncbi:hypothetical protein Hamer_G007240, partial [Homarus americanus]
NHRPDNSSFGRSARLAVEQLVRVRKTCSVAEKIVSDYNTGKRRRRSNYSFSRFALTNSKW